MLFVLHRSLVDLGLPILILLPEFVKHLVKHLEVKLANETLLESFLLFLLLDLLDLGLPLQVVMDSLRLLVDVR